MTTPFHGVYIEESSIGPRQAAQVASAIPFYIGTMPVHRPEHRANVNTIHVLRSERDASEVMALGLLSAYQAASDLRRATLYDAIRAHFRQYATAPIVIVNVADPDVHFDTEVDETHAYDGGRVYLDEPTALAILALRREVNAASTPGYSGTGNGTIGVALASDSDAADRGPYTATCTAAAGMDPAVFLIVTPQSPGGVSIDADGAAHDVDGVSVTLTEGSTPFDPGDEFDWSVAATMQAVDPSDYDLDYDSDDRAYVAISEAFDSEIEIEIDYTWLDGRAVSDDDVIGGYDQATEAWTGIALAHQVHAETGLVCSLLAAPLHSSSVAVAQALRAAGMNLGGRFRAHAIVDLDPRKVEIASIQAAINAKNASGLAQEGVSVCWPAVTLQLPNTPFGTLSTQIIALCGREDERRGGIPVASPSNKDTQISSPVVFRDDYSTEPRLFQQQIANALNAAGIITAIPESGRGIISWGNWTAIYPTSTDARVSFLSVRRMFDWVHNTIQLTVARDVDEPGNRRLLDTVSATLQGWINELVSRGALVGGDNRIEFREQDNPIQNLSAGIYRWHVTITPPSPAAALVFDVVYDPAGLSALFE